MQTDNSRAVDHESKSDYPDHGVFERPILDQSVKVTGIADRNVLLQRDCDGQRQQIPVNPDSCRRD